MKLLSRIMLSGALCVTTASAQDSVAVTDAQLSIPFGVADGRLVAVGNQFLFVGRSPEQSFALRKSNIIQSSAENDVLSIRTDAPVNNATEFTFRIDSDDAAGILSWLGAFGTPSSSSGTRTSADTFADSTAGSTLEASNLIGEYRVEHNHFLGECEGTLRITDDGIEFLSITEADHSRRWNMSDVKELERGDRDELRVAPMIGGEYDFDFVSERLISEPEFRRLSDLVAGARLDVHR